MRFAVFTHVPHTKRLDRYYAYAPYIREMNLWLDQVDQVEVVAPLINDEEISRIENVKKSEKGGKLEGRQGDNRIFYQHSKLNFNEIPLFNFLNFISAVKAVLKIPYVLFKILVTMKSADHLHLRCPGNVGLLASICQIFFPSKPKSAKYAGNWDPKATQPLTYKLQRKILSNTFLTRNMQVLVYGEWPRQSKNIIPFFTASFSEKEITEVNEKTFGAAITFLYVGNLVPGKQPLKAVELVVELQRKIQWISKDLGMKLQIYGDGPERAALESYCRNEQVGNLVELKGNMTLEKLKEAYQQAHFLILPSKSEGWPKAVAEAMFFGCIPIATSVSCVPWMLGYGERGILLSKAEKREEKKDQTYFKREGRGKRTKDEIEEQDALKILNLVNDREEMKRKSNAAKEWSQQYTLERFEKAIQDVLSVASEENQ